MKADLSRSTYRPEKTFRAVRAQQGRVALDAEHNEQHAIFSHRIETETVDTVGRSGGPLAFAGFELTAAGSNVNVGGPGRYYVDGLLCEIAAAVSLVNQPNLPPSVSPVLTAGQTFLSLPPLGAAALANIQIYDGAGKAVPPQDGFYIGYLEAWIHHVTAAEDPLLREVALGGPDGATRDRIVWQVKLLRTGDLGAPVGCSSVVQAWADLTKAPDGRLAARAEPSVPPKDPCLLSPSAGFRRLENLLYRVELHEDGKGGAPASYKWSRDNGSIETKVTRWLGEPTANEFEVASIGRDAYLAITGGCWVEFFDDTHAFTGRPGTLVKVLKTTGNVVTVDLNTATGPLDKDLYSKNARVRRWDGHEKMTPQPANNNAGWVELEDGVEIKFTPGSYRIGDFWCIPARTATENVEWPRDAAGPLFQAPQGILRAFARLAVLTNQGGVWKVVSDCRNLFPALTELTNLFYVGGDGQEAVPDPTKPATVPLASPLEVSVFDGQFPVKGATVRFTASNGTLPGGGASADVPTLANGIASVVWSIAPDVPDQTCKAQLLVDGVVVADRFDEIHFSARLSRAKEVAYDPAKCPDLAGLGVKTVQDAIDVLCQKTHGDGGCCNTVGPEAEFTFLDLAIRELIKRGTKDICLCLLPGDHKLQDDLHIEAPPDTHLSIHGAGRASRLRVDGPRFVLAGFESVTLRDFDIGGAGDLAVQIGDAVDVRIDGVEVSGRARAGASLVSVGAARTLEIVRSALRPAPQDALVHFGKIVEKLPQLEELEASLANSRRPPKELLEKLQKLKEGERDTFARDLEKFAASNSPSLPLNKLERLAFGGLAAAVRDRSDVLDALEKLRDAVRASRPRFALALQTATRTTLLSDSEFEGRVSAFGESTLPPMKEGDRKKVEQLARGGKLVFRPLKDADLRLRNNRLSDIRIGDGVARAILQGGTVPCYLSFIAESNRFDGPESEMIAVCIALCHNVLTPDHDVGTMFAQQGKYLGNYAADDIRLFAIAHNPQPEAFGNGALNVVVP